MEYLLPSTRSTFCEFKGQASYYTISVNDKNIPNGAWYYSKPIKGFESITHYVAFYAAKMDACYVNGEQAQILFTVVVKTHFGRGRRGIAGTD